MENLIRIYKNNKTKVQKRLKKFKELSSTKYLDEFLFCTLTPQSNAKKCWEAIKEIKSLKYLNEANIKKILISRTRFHNKKTLRIFNNIKRWPEIKLFLKNKNTIELRNTLAKKVNGYGLKEASHFLRNIGKSNNKIAILDRHILHNLNELKIINTTKIKSKKHYLEIEQKFLNFSDKIKIPIDELDLILWSKENGEIFK